MNISEIYTCPMYVFDIDVLNKRIDFLKEKLSSYGICYAIKANTFIVSALESRVDRFEVCSPGELEICYQRKIDLSKVVVSGVYKSASVIENAILNHDDIGCYTIESIGQLNLLDALTKKHKRQINVLIRLSSGNQFGLDAMTVLNVIKNRDEYCFLTFKGLEYYSGTQKISIKKLEKEINKIDDLIVKLNDEFDFEVEELEYGPGYPVSYFEGEEFNDEYYAEQLDSLLKQMNYNGKIILEIGRGIAASCGSYYTKIVDIKKTETQNYAIVDGGMNHLVYYGQMMAMRKPYFEVIPKRNDDIQIYTICGALCSVNDIILKQTEMDLKMNDIIIFKNTGAYCMTEGISLFLSRDLPKIYLYKNDEYHLIRDDIKTSVLNTYGEV